jgi:hypothetical protein
MRTHSMQHMCIHSIRVDVGIRILYIGSISDVQSISIYDTEYCIHSICEYTATSHLRAGVCVSLICSRFSLALSYAYTQPHHTCAQNVHRHVRVRYTAARLCQYLYYCTSKKKQGNYVHARLCEYLYLCTSKASKLRSTSRAYQLL